MDGREVHTTCRHPNQILKGPGSDASSNERLQSSYTSLPGERRQRPATTSGPQGGHQAGSVSVTVRSKPRAALRVGTESPVEPLKILWPHFRADVPICCGQLRVSEKISHEHRV